MIRGQFLNTLKLSGGLAIKLETSVQPALLEAKIGLVERPVFSHYFLPITILAELIFDRFRNVRGRLSASLKHFIALQINLSDDIFGVQFQCGCKMSSCLGQT